MIRSSDIPEKMTEMQLLEMLKKEASSVHIKDIMSASVYLRETPGTCRPGKESSSKGSPGLL